METIIKNIVSTHIQDLLNSIHYHYPDKFIFENIDTEFKYIIDNIEFTKIQNTENPNINKNKIIKKLPSPIDRCNARIWNYIYKYNREIKIDKIDAKFRVSDYNDIDIENFNANYTLGQQCTFKKQKNNIYCKIHMKHHPHGNFYENPSKELVFHYLQDGKYI